MIIENEKPITKPATQEVVFDGFWASQVIVNTPTPQSKGTVQIQLIPFNTRTQEVLNAPERILIDDVWAAAQETPEVATAVMALINAIDIVRKKKVIADAARLAAQESVRAATLAAIAARNNP